jgi:hypothetical protein
MTAQQFQLIETFLGRRLDLSSEQRQQTARNIADHIGVHLNLAPADRPQPKISPKNYPPLPRLQPVFTEKLETTGHLRQMEASLPRYLHSPNASSFLRMDT